MTTAHATHGHRKAVTALLLGALALTISGCDMIKMISDQFGSSWEGKERLVCGGDQEKTLENLKVNYVPASDDPWAGTAITAGGNCVLTLVNCEISAPTVIEAGGNAKVVIKGGRIEGTETALSAGGNAAIEIADGAEIVGQVVSGGSAKITGLPEQEKKQAKRDLSRKFSKGACTAVIRCHKEHQAYGNVQGLVSGQVDPSGKVTSTRYSNGSAPDKVQQCLRQAMEQLEIKDFDGKPGELRCQYAGTLTAGTQMLSLDPQFVRNAEAP